MKRVLDGVLHGVGFLVVVAVAFAIAWAGDVLTVDKDGALKFAVSDQGKITVGATESYVNLVIQNNGAAATNKVDITADVLTVEGIRLENLNVSADITAAVGAGGRDTNFPDATGWYYVWVITNNDGTQKNGILTLAPATPNPPTPPTLPSGYTKYRRVGAVRNNASNDFLQFVQEGNRIHIDFNNNYILSAGQAVSWTTVGVGEYVSPTSRRSIVVHAHEVRHNAAGVSFSSNLRKVGSSASVGQLAIWFKTTVASASIDQVQRFQGDVDLNNSQQFEYKINQVPSNGGGTWIWVVGYYDRI